MIYTHSKIFAVLILCISLITSVYISQKNKKVEARERAETISVEVNKQSDLDSDGDGLKDWEEALLGTNPNKQDSDGDGVLDSKESEQSFVFKPKEATDDISLIKQSSLTGEVAQNFFVNYLSEQKNSEDLTTDQIDKIASDSTEDVTLYFTPKFEIKDIKVSKLKTKSEYEQEMADAFYSGSIKDKKQKTELEIIENALKGENKQELKKLLPIIDSYNAVINNTLKISAPPDAVGLHLTYLNALKDVKENIEGASKILDDPVYGFLHLNNYQLNIKKLQMVLYKISQYFQN